MKLQEILKKDKITTDDDIDDMLDVMIEINKPEYTKLKLLEKLAELSEVLLKSINKSPQRQPSREDIIGETGDVIMRCYLYLESIKQNEEVEDLIKSHLLSKMNRFLGYLKEGKYTSGL